MGQLDEILLECLQRMQNTSFYSVFGRSRPIVSMDSYNETVHREPFQLSHDRRI